MATNGGTAPAVMMATLFSAMRARSACVVRLHTHPECGHMQPGSGAVRQLDPGRQYEHCGRHALRRLRLNAQSVTEQAHERLDGVVRAHRHSQMWTLFSSAT